MKALIDREKTGRNITGKDNMFEKWTRIADQLDFALQPIVNINSGDCYGVVFRLRGHEKCGFDTIRELFDVAFRER